MKTLIALLLLMAFNARGQDTSVLYFDFDKAMLTSEAKQNLDRFISLFRNDPASTLMIRGHCDAKGTDAYNELLSKKRSFVVHEYLLNHGIPKTSIVLTEGFGEREPLNNNSTEEERQFNRRVEIIRIQRDAPAPVSKKNPRDTISEFSKAHIDSAKEGQVLRLRNINFYGGRHLFLPQSMPALEELLDVMKKNPALVIEIHGHICCQIGSASDGADFDTGDSRLSVNRAKAVYDYLIENGIDANRMSYKGFAATEPLINPELTEEDRTLNRRVEIKIIKK